MALSLLGSATRSLLDFVETELRTVFAIAFGDRSGRAMQPLASRSSPTILGRRLGNDDRTVRLIWTPLEEELLASLEGTLK